MAGRPATASSADVLSVGRARPLRRPSRKLIGAAPRTARVVGRVTEVVLYTCAARKKGADGPVVKHPCGVAAKALDQTGHEYELKVVGGFKMVPFSRRGRRDEIVSLTGQEDVPVLLLDDGTVVQGTGAIAEWAAGNPARS